MEEFPLSDGFTGGCRDINGVRLHYVTGGQGPLVLLVHGFGQTWYDWKASRSPATCRIWSSRTRNAVIAKAC